MKQSKIFMIVGALLLVSLFFLPLWNITLEAPQYPDPLGMDIHINKFTDTNFNDINNINIMNHYVGMKDIPEHIPEFDLFPYFVAGMILLGVIFGLIGKRNLYLVWIALMIVLGAIAMYDFYQWEYEYGHDLKETAAIKFTDEKGDPMTYQPPLIGSKVILNFKAVSMPRVGTYLLLISMMSVVLAYRQAKKEKSLMKVVPILSALFLLMGCSIEPQPIQYGQDACHFCKMTIVDNRHASELVTVKGKAYKYDAIECMMNDLNKWDNPPVKFFLTSDYSKPGELIDASKAYYLISASIPSPMGEFLTAFNETDQLDQTISEHGGERLTWDQLLGRFNVML